MKTFYILRLNKKILIKILINNSVNKYRLNIKIIKLRKKNIKDLY